MVYFQIVQWWTRSTYVNIDQSNCKLYRYLKLCKYSLSSISILVCNIPITIAFLTEHENISLLLFVTTILTRRRSSSNMDFSSITQETSQALTRARLAQNTFPFHISHQLKNWSNSGMENNLHWLKTSAIIQVVWEESDSEASPMLLRQHFLKALEAKENFSNSFSQATRRNFIA